MYSPTKIIRKLVSIDSDKDVTNIGSKNKVTHKKSNKPSGQTSNKLPKKGGVEKYGKKRTYENKTTDENNIKESDGNTTTDENTITSVEYISSLSVNKKPIKTLTNPMKKYRFEVSDDMLPVSDKKYKIKKLEDVKQKLSTAKSQLDNEFSKYIFGKYWKEFDPFKNEKNIIATLGNTYNITNAWIKCYELINHFELIPDNLSDEKYIHFDNAAFPGSFILSVHHFVNTNRLWKNKYDWVGSSLLDSNDENKDPLEDKYKLYETYRNKWLMSETNNGDVLLEENQRDFNKRLGGTIDLYTSDLGFDVSSDYNNQELIQAPANIGQILTGLLTLKAGGCFITKQYSIFEAVTLSIMYATASFFDEFYICKPYSSREANSETYLVGKGFKGNVSLDHPYIKAMLDRITKRVNINVPLFDAKDYPKSYMSFITKAAEEIFNGQIQKINADVSRVSLCMRNRHNGHPSTHPIVKEFYENEKDKLQEWCYTNPIRVINNSDRLKMQDVFKQAKDALVD